MCLCLQARDLGPLQTVLLLQRQEKKPEGDARRAVIEESSTEGDATGRSTFRAESSVGKDAAGKGEERKESSSGRDVDSEEEEVEESSERVQRESLTTCHVPGFTWLEQVRARIRAINSYRAAINESAGRITPDKKEKKERIKYTLHLTEKQREYL
ncbi:hypothetical protein NDU88_003352 [Pleurodeles waltl]|uniref:Uncharacterized protein n=1 Tax=Pleurodeles waltl TaxID=8319 RepID=A0AAV7RFM4_PLEWA|nr:hypothetical protein NDU88_003352 [Pleurodeles waltl]